MIKERKFGVWMDSQHATIVGESPMQPGNPEILGHVKSEVVSSNSSEKSSNNQAQTVQGKFFKEISLHLQNATHIHITGTGQAQEQFMHYLSSTPQFKNTKTSESTSNRMSDDKLIAYFEDK
jgi:hypothetical protein